MDDRLHLAADAGDTNTIVALLDQGADIDKLDTDRRTPLMRAVIWGQVEIVKLLLEKGADAGLFDIEFRSAMSYASRTLEGDMMETGPVYDVLLAYWKARYMAAKPIPEDQARLYLEVYAETKGVNGKLTLNLKNGKRYEGWFEVGVPYKSHHIMFMPKYLKSPSLKDAKDWEDIDFSEIDLDSLVWE